MKRLLLSSLVLFWSVALLAGDSISVSQIKDVFCQMPDSLLPSLSQNNRLDLIDFHLSGMKAEVENRFGGTSRMTSLTVDSLSLSLSECKRVDMLLFTLEDSIETGSQVVVFAETFLVDTLYGETVIRFYTTDWQPITRPLPLNQQQRRIIEILKMQNILKWSDKVLKNS